MLVLALASRADAAPTIGALVDREHRMFCTGTLLTRDVVLTAAHCVVKDGIVKWPYAFYVGDDIRLGGVFARVVTGAVHPEYDPLSHANDLAVLRIIGKAPAVTLPGLASEIPAVDTELRAVGFGHNAVAARAFETRVIARTDGAFRYAPGTCPGDSGGPLLTLDGTGTWRITGVVSTGSIACTDARAVAVAPAQAWIASAIEVVDPIACRTGDARCGTCGIGDGDCVCVARDGACRLCAGVDDDCAPACDADGVCALSCLAPDPDCGTREAGSTCALDEECASSACHYGVCRERCEIGIPTCAPWEGCVQPTAGARSLCLPPHELSGGCSANHPSALGLALLWLTAVLRRDRFRLRPPPERKEAPCNAPRN